MAHRRVVENGIVQPYRFPIGDEQLLVGRLILPAHPAGSEVGDPARRARDAPIALAIFLLEAGNLTERIS